MQLVDPQKISSGTGGRQLKRSPTWAAGKQLLKCS